MHPESFFSICSRPALLAVTPETLPPKQANSFKDLWLKVEQSIKAFYLKKIGIVNAILSSVYYCIVRVLI